MDDLIKLNATEIVKLRRRGELSATELVEASINRIEQIDDVVNAMPIRCFDRALDVAKKTRFIVHR